MKTYTLEIKQDTDIESPRTSIDQIGKMICFHRSYNLGDKHSLTVNQGKKLEKKMNSKGVCLPLYLYNHSGLTIATTPFSCRWDSGKIGFIYIDSKAGRGNWGRYWKKKAIRCLEAEVKEYDQYLRGDVYDYVIWEKEDEKEPENVYSCWGYYGEEAAKEAGEKKIQHYNKLEHDRILNSVIDPVLQGELLAN